MASAGLILPIQYPFHGNGAPDFATGAGMPRRVSLSAIWRNDAPPAFRGAMTGSRSAVRLSALAAFAALPLALPSIRLRRLAGLPGLTPRALAAAKAALVRWEIIAASC